MDEQAPAGGASPGDDSLRFAGRSPCPDRVFEAIPGSRGAPRFDPILAADDDSDSDGHFEWLVREIDEGRMLPPPESAVEGPVISVSLGDACDVDPELLAAMCGPDGLGGEAVSAVFGQDKAADVLRPGPVLAALAAQAVASAGMLTDNELIGALQAARRMANHAAYQQVVVIAEFARRRQAEFEATKARGVPVGCRDGEFPGEELAMELVTSRSDAGARIDTAIDLSSRLPRTLAAMEAGAIDLARASTIAFHTRGMTDKDAAYADEVLASAAPGKRYEQLARKAAALELKLAPETVAARKTLARQDQRVEARREESGNASLSGRELDTADVVASKAYIDAIAAKLRGSGLIDGGIGRLRALALTDLTQGRNPLDRIKPRPLPVPGNTPSAEDAPGAATNPAEKEYQSGSARAGNEPCHQPHQGPRDRFANEIAARPGCGAERSPVSVPTSARFGESAPVPALITILVPAGTLLGWSTAPAEAMGWGLLDAGEARAIVQAAAKHPRTRWCATFIAPDGTAIAHGCAAGQHPWPPPDSRVAQDPSSKADDGATRHRANPNGGIPPSPGRDPAPPGDPFPSCNPRTSAPPSHGIGALNGTGEGPSTSGSTELLELLRRLNVTLEPVARDACDHQNAESRYVPSRKLKHLVSARAQVCSAPACNAQAVYCDVDHTVPYPEGPTDQCNLSPKCRRHHRTKQAPGWTVAQPTPDTATWTTPSGRAHTTMPTVYDS